MADWYYYEGDEKIGPFSPSDLRHKVRDGVITRSTRVRSDDMEQRVPAEKVKGLFKASRRSSVTFVDEVYIAAPKGLNPVVGFLGFLVALAVVGGAIFGLIFLLENKAKADDSSAGSSGSVTIPVEAPASQPPSRPSLSQNKPSCVFQLAIPAR